MRVDGFGGVMENLLFESMSQVEDDVVSVSFDSKREKVDFEFYSSGC